MRLLRELLSFCDQCAGEQTHAVCASYQDDWTHDLGGDFSVWGGSNNFILKCAECGQISFRSEKWDSENIDQKTKELNTEIDIYPRRPDSRDLPAWFEELMFADGELERGIEAKLTEVYRSLDQKLYWMCLIGTRAIVERVMLAKIPDQGSFVSNLSHFRRQGLISEQQHLALERGLGGSDSMEALDEAKAQTAIRAAEEVIGAVLFGSGPAQPRT